VEYSDRLIEAFRLACELHRTQQRKGSATPYVTHLMAVAAAVGDYGGSEDQVIAALLHDAVEDQGGIETLDRIRAAFGECAAGYVMACSDSSIQPKPPWRARKEAFVARVTEVDGSVRLIIAADKLHNARSLIRTLRESGSGAWDYFKGGRDGTLWYYGEMVRALSRNWNHPILRELADTVESLHRTAADLQSRG
jgi:GTP pyrophosphokinase